ncbi:MAG: acyl-CoA synthetase [Flavobacteriaceae bacterium]
MVRAAAISARRYGAALPPPRYNFVRELLAGFNEPRKPALVFARDGTSPSGDDLWTYARLADGVHAAMRVLRDRGVARGERILLRMHNGPEYALAYLGASAIGAVPIPLATGLTETEIEFLAEDSDAAAIIAGDELAIGSAASGRIAIEQADFAAAITRGDSVPQPFADTSRDDPAYQVYTSGSTSRPKGVVHAHRAIFGRRPMYDGWYEIGPPDVMLHSGALNWTYALGTGFIDPLANGATAVLHKGTPDANVWPQLARRFSVTIFASVPGIYRILLRENANMGPALRHCLTAGEAMPAAMAEAWRTLTGRPVCEAFGMSEISTYISTPPSFAARPGSPGRPQPGRAVAILPVDGGDTPLARGETGVLAVHRSDPGLMLGYWGRPDEEAESMRSDWFVTGDLATMDDDGFVFPQGRADDMINAMGYRVSPDEVEAALEGDARVLEAAAVEYRPSPGVSLVAAFIVPARNGQIDLEAIKHDVASRLAIYKRPRHLEIVAELPKTANGKLRRRALREALNSGS